MESWENSLQISALSSRSIRYYSSFYFVLVCCCFSLFCCCYCWCMCMCCVCVCVCTPACIAFIFMTKVDREWKRRNIFCCLPLLMWIIGRTGYPLCFNIGVVQCCCCIAVSFTLNFPTSTAIIKQKLCRNHIQHRQSAWMNWWMEEDWKSQRDKIEQTYYTIVWNFISVLCKLYFSFFPSIWFNILD